MQFERLIASRLATSKSKSFTRVIIGIATAAIAISLAVMITATAMISGFKKEISSKIFGFWGHIHVTDTRAFRSYEALPIEKDTAIMAPIARLKNVTLQVPRRNGFDMEDQFDLIATKGGVRHVQAYAQVPGILTSSDEIEGIILKGIGPDFEWKFLEEYMVAGSAMQLTETTISDGIIISEYTAGRMQIEVGERCIIHFVKDKRQIQRRFTVSGIFRTGLEDYDKKFALVDIQKVQELLGWSPNQVAGYEIFVDDLDEAEVINEYIYIEKLPAELYSVTIRQKFPNIFEWLDLQNVNEMVILALTLVVSVINMITALLILILERTNMIGILKALGSRNWSIQKIFLYQAGIIIGAGLFWGNILGIGLCLLQRHFKLITLNEADYYLSYAPINLNWLHVIALNAGTLIITLLFLLIPSLLVMRISPVKSIRFK